MAYGTPYRQLTGKTRTAFVRGEANRTLTKQQWKRLNWQRRLDARRQKGISDFWTREQMRLQKGLPGTRNWNREATSAILRGEIPKGISSHHRYSVGAYPQLADDLNNIYPVTHFEHFHRWHGGRWGATHGVPLSPEIPEWF